MIFLFFIYSCSTRSEKDLYESNANLFQILMNEKEHLPFEIVVTLPQNNLIESMENDYTKYSLQITKNFIDTLNLKSLNQLYDK